MAKERAKGWMTGMRGVYLAAAELTRMGFVVSPTSRSAFGADLLVTDEQCTHAWSVQVKTNRKPVRHWLVNKKTADTRSDSHIYMFVNLKANDERPEFFVVPSPVVAGVMRKQTYPKGTFYWFDRKDVADEYREFWGAFTAPGKRPLPKRPIGAKSNGQVPVPQKTI